MLWRDHLRRGVAGPRGPLGRDSASHRSLPWSPSIPVTQAAIVCHASNDDDDLEGLRDELQQLLAAVAEDECQLAALREELDAFSSRLDRLLAPRYAELDRLEAEIAEVIALRNRADAHAQRDAEEARERATRSRRVADAPAPPRDPPPFRPAADLKALYRKLARRVHPDGGTDDADRARRTRLMAEVNAAYRAEDHTRLEAILASLESDDTTDPQQSPDEARRRLEALLQQARERSASLARALAELRESPIGRSKAMLDEHAAYESEVLATLAEGLDARIAAARARLQQLEDEPLGVGPVVR